MKTFLLTCWLGIAGVSAFAGVFSDLPFDAARNLAAGSGKIVLIDFYTTWCGPCKMLDKTTWTDPAVIQLLESKTVALRLDAEKETALAQRYRIAAYPTVLLLKADGSEIDRLVGYREPQAFISDFTASLAGKDSVKRAQEAVEKAPAGDASARMQYGQALAQKGMDAEALKEYVWCFDHGLEKDQSFTGVRLSFLLSDIMNLANHYPAAKAALVTRRDDRNAKLIGGSTDYQNIVDLISLNKTLGETQRNMVVFDKLPANSKTRVIVRRLIVEQLLDAKRYADVLDGTDGKSDFERSVSRFNAVIGMLHNSTTQALIRSSTAKSGAQDFEALAGLKRNDEGKELGRLVLEFDSSQETRDALAKGATRAGNLELAEFAKEYQVKKTAQ
ncbi:MAG TPA: thioredoxin family protein [Verrucomicrobiae bacterium]